MTPRRAARRSDPFRALADPTRRSILEWLQRRASPSAGEIAERFPDLSRPAVSRHLRVLREAGLVTAEGIGREQRYRLNRGALARMHRDWFAQFTPLRDDSLRALKNQIEAANRADAPDTEMDARPRSRSSRSGRR